MFWIFDEVMLTWQNFLEVYPSLYANLKDTLYILEFKRKHLLLIQWNKDTVMQAPVRNSIWNSLQPTLSKKKRKEFCKVGKVLSNDIDLNNIRKCWKASLQRLEECKRRTAPLWILPLLIYDSFVENYFLKIISLPL